MPAPGSTPIIIYNSATASQVPSAANLSQGELAINVTDKKLYTKDSGGNVILIASNGGDVTGPATATDNAIARFDSTTGKLIQNSVVTIADTTGNMAGVGTLSAGAITSSALTSGRVTFASTGGLLADNANFVWDNTNARLGIGTASPTAKLDVAGSAYVSAAGTLSFKNNVPADYGYIGTGSIITGGVATDFAIRANTGNMTFATNGSTERMRLDSSGNLGLGVTPSAWGGTNKGVEVFNGLGLSSSSSLIAGYSQNAYNDGTNWIYRFTNPASLYLQTTGTHSWRIAPSGTAGNAITFTQAMTLDASGNLGIDTSNPIYRLQVGNATTTSTLGVIPDGTNGTALRWGGTGAGAGVLRFLGQSDTERMRIDSSGNLGIGTASPSTYGKLAVVGANGSGNTILSSYGGTTAGDYGLLVLGTGTTAKGSMNVDATGNNVRFDTRGNSADFLWASGASYTERMRLDYAGNLGLGVTPSAWGGTGKSLQIGNAAAAITGSGSATAMSANLYYDGTNYIYVSSFSAVLYQQNVGAGAHRWYTAPLGTAGATATLTQAMTLNNSGNLGIGTASPTAKLHVLGTGNNVVVSETTGTTNIAQVKAIGTGAKQSYLWQASASYPTYQSLVANNAGIYATTNLSYEVDGAFYQSWWTNATERMRLDSSGNLGIGTTSPDVKLQVSSASLAAIKASITSSAGNVARLQLTGGTADYAWYVTDNANYTALYDYNAGAERMRIDASGNLCIGTTTAAAKLDVRGTDPLYAATNYGSYTIRGISTTGQELHIRPNSGKNGFISFTEDSVADKWVLGVEAGNTALLFKSGSASSNTERMRIDSSGNLLVGTTAQLVANNFQVNINSTSTTRGLIVKVNNSATPCSQFWVAGNSFNNTLMTFTTDTSQQDRGSIVYNRSGGVIAYNTTSDYRAKDIIGPVENALEDVSELKVHLGLMKGATQARPMFIAHELQEFIPYAVTGEKDAVDEEGKPIYQQLDAGILIPLLTKAIQEQQAMIDELKAKVAALEAA